MEYYPLQDITTGQYWKLKVTNGVLCLEENNQSESEPNPVINDRDGTTWILYVESGYLKLTDITTQPDTQFYLHDPAGDVWRVVINNGVIGVEKMSKEQTVLDLSHYPLDCRSGRWLDLSRKGNHGVPHGGARPYMIAPGVMGYWFDGSSGYIELPKEVVSEDNCSISLWAEAVFSALDSYDVRFFNSRHTSGGTSEFRFVGGNNISFYFGNGSSSAYVKVGPTPSDNKLTCFTVTWRYDGANTTVEGYTNGEKRGQKVISGKIICPDIDIEIAKWRDYYFRGVIAGVVVEDRAWSPDEVRENMYRSPIYRMLRGLLHSVYIKVPWKQTQGGIYVP